MEVDIKISYLYRWVLRAGVGVQEVQRDQLYTIDDKQYFYHDGEFFQSVIQIENKFYTYVLLKQNVAWLTGSVNQKAGRKSE